MHGADTADQATVGNLLYRLLRVEFKDVVYVGVALHFQNPRSLDETGLEQSNLAAQLAWN